MSPAPHRIVGASVRTVQGQSEGARNARTSWRERCCLLLTVQDTLGHRGRGEASPLPGYTIDDLPTAEAALRSVDWSAAPPIPPPAHLVPWVRELLGRLPRSAPSATCAVEAALLDLVSRAWSVPILDLLGSPHRQSLPLAHVLHVDMGAQAMREASSLVAAGFGTLKVKVGAPGAFEPELQFLTSLRQHMGDRIRLRIDANGGLGGPGLRDRLTALCDLRPEFIEEPATADELAAIGQGPWIVGLDESLFPNPEACISSRATAGSIVVLKPMALGGILRCLDLAGQATHAGARVVVTHTLDGPIAWSVAATLALIVHEHDVAAGLAPHPGLSAWPAHPLPGVDGPIIRTTSNLGWGIEWPSM